jgi:repressor LexA
MQTSGKINKKGGRPLSLTQMQEKVFRYICTFSKENGFPPAYSDISSEFNFSSDGTVRTYLEHLEKKQYIKRLGKARGIKILKPIDLEKSIPILGKIAAGPLQLPVEDLSGHISEIKEIQHEEGRFALRIAGDSMKDAGILDGDYAIIQTMVPIHNGQIAAVIVDDEATLKRIYYEEDRVRLQPENEFYKPIYIKRDHSNAHFIGRYIALIRKA